MPLFVHRRSGGFTLLELFVVCAVVGVLAVFSLQRLWAMQQAAEEAMVEQVVGVLKNAVRIRTAELISAKQWDEFRHLPQRNPFDWLEELPGNYRGELKGEGVAGFWYFDAGQRSVVYFVKRADDFHASDGTQTLRFTVVGVDGNGQVRKEAPFSWLALRPQAEYLWLGRVLR